MSTLEPDKDNLRLFLSAANALQAAMDTAQRSVGSYHIDNWVGYKQYATKYMALFQTVSAETTLPSVKGGGKTYHWGCRCPA